MRLFAAVVPPESAVEDLEAFLAVRRDAARGLRWTDPEQWHVTVAFAPDVPTRSFEELVERLAVAAARRSPFEVSLGGGGAFPDPSRAKVVYADVTTSDDSELRQLSVGARAAITKSGAEVEGGRFTPHVTLARSGRPFEASRWLRVLDTYRGPTWPATELTLVESHLGEGPRGRPRHEVVARLPLVEKQDAVGPGV